MTTTDPQTDGRVPGLLAAHHRELDHRLDQLVAQAQDCDPVALRKEWSAFERELSRHLELEEAEILAGFAQHDRAAARAILAEHAQIRSDLLELGLNLDLHCLRAEAVESFVQRLRAHAQREEAALYPWAGDHVTRGGWTSIKRGLRQATAAGRSVMRLGHRII